MKEYCIISVDETRARNKESIRNSMQWKEASIPFVDGRIPAELEKSKAKWNNIDTPGPFKAGEFGIFYSVLNALEYGSKNNGILYFEDDAILTSNFQDRLNQYVDELPHTADMLAVWSPENQRGDYDCVRTYNNLGEPLYGEKIKPGSIFDYGHEQLCYLWQGYGNVAMFFTKKGSSKMLDYIGEKGFFSPIDCLICIAVHSGRLTGYALKPTISPLIEYNWNTPTTIHKSRWGSIYELMEVNK